jgi:hypothetical protein
MAESTTQYEENIVRVFALIAAGILLNLGMFFVLSVFAPLVIGLLSGFFFTRYQKGILTGFVSALIAYAIIFIATSFTTMDVFATIIAVLIMAFLGAMGGAIGVYLHSRTVNQ